MSPRIPSWLVLFLVAVLALATVQTEAANSRLRRQVASGKRATIRSAAAGGGGSGALTAWGRNLQGQSAVPSGLLSVKAVAAGAAHTVALRSNGTVLGWGDNSAGQAVPPGGLSQVKAVAAGGMHSLALRANGTVAGWGSNGEGQAAPPGGLARVMAISAGGLHSLALLADGTVTGWGADGEGQVAGAAGHSEVISIAAGGSHSLALKADGTVAAWGRNDEGQCNVPAGLMYVRAIAAGGSHSLAVRNDGTVAAWGSNSDGQTDVPVDLVGVIAVAAGDTFSLALRSNGTVVTWGGSADGQTLIPDGTEYVTAISAGGAHALALSAHSWVRDWGGESISTFGMGYVKALAGGGRQVLALSADGRVTYSGTSTSVSPAQPWTPPSWLEGVAAIGLGRNIGLAALDTGALVAWGYPNYDQTVVPPQVSGYRGSMEAGSLHCVALTGDGSVVEWGRALSEAVRQPPPAIGKARSVAADHEDSYALLPDGTVRRWYDGTQLTAFGSDVIEIAAGFDHLLALRADGTVFGVGEGSSGQLVTEGLTNVVAIAAGAGHSMALRADGTVVVWGSNSNGQRNIPTPLPVATGVAASDISSLAIVTGARPSLAPIPDQETFEDLASDTIPYSITDADATSFSLSAVVEPPSLVKSVTFSGSTANGTLRLVPADNVSGTATVTVTASDFQMSDSTTFQFTILPINDRPSFTRGPEISVMEDSGPQVFPNWAVNRIAGPPDEAGQGLHFELTNGNPSLFSVQPVLDASNGRLTFTPAPNAYGGSGMSVVLVDDGGNINGGQDRSVVQTFSISINGISDDPPSAAAVAVTVPEDSFQSITLAGSDPDDDALTYTVVTEPSHGTLAPSSGNGRNRTYTPAPNYHGPDSFTYRVTDGTSFSAPATVSITVQPGNDPPVASPQTVNLLEDAVTPITLAGTDIDGDTLTYQVIAQPAHGMLSGTGANRTYTPEANYAGPDSFTFRVSDGSFESPNATVTLNIAAQNDAPVARDQAIFTQEDTPVPINLGATDVEGQALTYSIVSGPSSGLLTGSAPSLTYVPEPGFNGMLSFTFEASDGTLDSNVAVISITVGPSNDPPTAGSMSVSTPEDTPIAVGLQATDPDGDTLSYFLVNGPQHGTLTGSGAGRTYTPEANFHGTDSFTFRATDGMAESSTATVTLTVTSRNDVPEALSQTVQTPEDTSLAITLTGQDADGDGLSYQVAANPANGTLTGSGTSRTYLPDANFSGTDSFTFRVSDGTTQSATATVTINVAPRNDAPTARDQAVFTVRDTPVPINLGATDPEGSALTYFMVSGPSAGFLTGTAPALTYVPAPGFYGTLSFTFGANDGTFDSNIATVTITVGTGNEPPNAVTQSLSTAEDTPLPLTLAGTDPDGDSLTYLLINGPQHGTLTGAGANRTYTPEANYHGTDSFTFRAFDGLAESSTATLNLTISPRNDAPEAFGQTVQTPEDTSLAIVLTGRDVDGDALTYQVASNPANGTLTGTGASRTYQPAPDFRGTDGFTFRTGDGTTNSGTATVTINVGARNDAPVARDQSLSTQESTAVAVTLGASDIDGDALTFVVAVGPAHGTLSGSGANRSYLPNPGYHGGDTFTFRANDGATDSNLATVTLTVHPLNDAPTALGQALGTAEDTPLPITLVGRDLDGDTLTYRIVSPPSRGTLSGTGADRTYSPDANYHGSDSFTFQVTDGLAESAVATVSITVAARNDAPTAQSQAVSTAEESAKTITLGGTDPEGDSLTFEIVSGPAHGVLSGSGAGRTYTPNADFTGSDSFTFRVRDGSAESAAATVTLTVTPVNDPPSAGADAGYSTGLSTLLTVPAPGVLGNDMDVDGDALTAVLQAGPAHGELTLSANGAFTYTPDPGYSGSDSFTYRAFDGQANSATVTVTITVTTQLPASTAKARITGTGKVSIQGKAATVKVNVTTSAKGRPSGTLSMTIPRGASYKSTSITAVVLTGSKAVILGKATGPGRVTVDFVVVVEDGGKSPTLDRFRLDTSDPFTTGGALPLTTGNLVVTRLP